jgi:acyl-CoA hydrolase
LADGTELPALSQAILDHILGQVVGGLLMDIVANGEPAVGCRVRRGQVAAEVVLRLLDQGGSVQQIIFGVQVKVGDVVSKGGHICFAARCSVTIGIWRSHVCWEKAEDIAKSHLVVVHLVLPLGLGEFLLALGCVT